MIKDKASPTVLHAEVQAAVDAVLWRGGSAPEPGYIADLSLEEQVRCWQALYHTAFDVLTRSERMVRAPEREQFDVLTEELHKAQTQAKWWEGNAGAWKDIAAKLGKQIDQMQQGTRVAFLEEQVRCWKRRWRQARRHFTDALEHLPAGYQIHQHNIDADVGIDTLVEPANA